MKKRYAILAAIMILPVTVLTLLTVFRLQYPKFHVVDLEWVLLIWWLGLIIVPIVIFFCSFIRQRILRIILTVLLCSACILGSFHPILCYVTNWVNIVPFISYTTNPKNYLEFEKDFKLTQMSGEYDEYCENVKKYFPADISDFEEVEYEYSHEYFAIRDFDIVLKFKATDDEVKRFYEFPDVTEYDENSDCFSVNLNQFSSIWVKYDKTSGVMKYSLLVTYD